MKGRRIEGDCIIRQENYNLVVMRLFGED